MLYSFDILLSNSYLKASWFSSLLSSPFLEMIELLNLKDFAINFGCED